MSFKEECIEEYRKSKKHKEEEKKKTMDNNRRNTINKFCSELNQLFGLNATVDDIILNENMNLAIYEIDQIKLSINIHSYRYNDIHLIILCDKCGTGFFGERVSSKGAIGHYLCEDSSKYICQNCKFEEQDKNRKELNKKRKEEQDNREKKISFKMARTFAEFLSFHGFRIEYPPEFYDEEYCDDGDPF